MNGPVPAGRREKSCPIFSTAGGETGASGESATILKNGPYGCLKRVRELAQGLGRRRAIRDLRVERVDVLPGGEDDLAPGLRVGVRHQRGEKEQQDRDGRGHGRLLTSRAGAARRRVRSRR